MNEAGIIEPSILKYFTAIVPERLELSYALERKWLCDKHCLSQGVASLNKPGQVIILIKRVLEL